MVHSLVVRPSSDRSPGNFTSPEGKYKNSFHWERLIYDVNFVSASRLLLQQCNGKNRRTVFTRRIYPRDSVGPDGGAATLKFYICMSHKRTRIFPSRETMLSIDETFPGAEEIQRLGVARQTRGKQPGKTRFLSPGSGGMRRERSLMHLQLRATFIHFAIAGIHFFLLSPCFSTFLLPLSPYPLSFFLPPIASQSRSATPSVRRQRGRRQRVVFIRT